MPEIGQRDRLHKVDDRHLYRPRSARQFHLASTPESCNFIHRNARFFDEAVERRGSRKVVSTLGKFESKGSAKARRAKVKRNRETEKGRKGGKLTVDQRHRRHGHLLMVVRSWMLMMMVRRMDLKQMRPRLREGRRGWFPRARDAGADGRVVVVAAKLVGGRCGSGGAIYHRVSLVVVVVVIIVVVAVVVVCNVSIVVVVVVVVAAGKVVAVGYTRSSRACRRTTTTTSTATDTTTANAVDLHHFAVDRSRRLGSTRRGRDAATDHHHQTITFTPSTPGTSSSSSSSPSASTSVAAPSPTLPLVSLPAFGRVCVRRIHAVFSRKCSSPLPFSPPLFFSFLSRGCPLDSSSSIVSSLTRKFADCLESHRKARGYCLATRNDTHTPLDARPKKKKKKKKKERKRNGGPQTSETGGRLRKKKKNEVDRSGTWLSATLTRCHKMRRSVRVSRWRRSARAQSTPGSGVASCVRLTKQNDILPDGPSANAIHRGASFHVRLSRLRGRA